LLGTPSDDKVERTFREAPVNHGESNVCFGRDRSPERRSRPTALSLVR